MTKTLLGLAAEAINNKDKETVSANPINKLLPYVLGEPEFRHLDRLMGLVWFDKQDFKDFFGVTGPQMTYAAKMFGSSEFLMREGKVSDIMFPMLEGCGTKVRNGDAFFEYMKEITPLRKILIDGESEPTTIGREQILENIDEVLNDIPSEFADYVNSAAAIIGEMYSGNLTEFEGLIRGVDHKGVRLYLSYLLLGRTIQLSNQGNSIGAAGLQGLIDNLTNLPD